MKTKEITIQVEAEAADIYRSSSKEKKHKLDALLSSRLREVTRPRNHGKSLEEIMHEMSRQAQARGLTPQKLDEILNEK
jgi:predicted lipid-binding transport protein (Tim44 family)